MKIRQSRLTGYLAVTAGVGCASSAANAAVVFYGNAANTNIQADPVGISIGLYTSPFVTKNVLDLNRTINFKSAHGTLTYFTRGTDLIHLYTDFGFRGGQYTRNGGFVYGAVAGDQNYANISFNGHDTVYEAVAQFYLDGSGGGYLMAIATNNAIPNPQDLSAVGGSGLSISAGKAMIDAAAVSAVPEPSSHLALLALGSVGLLTRRRMKRAA